MNGACLGITVTAVLVAEGMPETKRKTKETKACLPPFTPFPAQLCKENILIPDTHGKAALIRKGKEKGINRLSLVMD